MGWGCVMSRAVDLRERLERSLGEMQESGAAEICELLWETMRPTLDAEPSIRAEHRAQASQARDRTNGPPRRGAVAAGARLRRPLPAAARICGATGRALG